jgi:hypothetical protein
VGVVNVPAMCVAVVPIFKAFEGGGRLWQALDGAQVGWWVCRCRITAAVGGLSTSHAMAGTLVLLRCIDGGGGGGGVAVPCSTAA